VFSVRQKLPAQVLAFSSEAAWMASADDQGNVLLWDLQAKRILYKFDHCLNGPIDSLIFMPGLPVLTVASSQANSIRQLRVNLEDNKVLSVLR
jgi:WD40 repeat protein